MRFRRSRTVEMRIDMHVFAASWLLLSHNSEQHRCRSLALAGTTVNTAGRYVAISGYFVSRGPRFRSRTYRVPVVSGIAVPSEVAIRSLMGLPAQFQELSRGARFDPFSLFPAATLSVSMTCVFSSGCKESAATGDITGQR